MRDCKSHYGPTQIQNDTHRRPTILPRHACTHEAIRRIVTIPKSHRETLSQIASLAGIRKQNIHSVCVSSEWLRLLRPYSRNPARRLAEFPKFPPSSSAFHYCALASEFINCSTFGFKWLLRNVNQSPAQWARAMLAQPLLHTCLMPKAMPARQFPSGVAWCQGLTADCATDILVVFSNILPKRSFTLSSR